MVVTNHWLIAIVPHSIELPAGAHLMEHLIGHGPRNQSNVFRLPLLAKQGYLESYDAFTCPELLFFAATASTPEPLVELESLLLQTIEDPWWELAACEVAGGVYGPGVLVDELQMRASPLRTGMQQARKSTYGRIASQAAVDAGGTGANQCAELDLVELRRSWYSRSSETYFVKSAEFPHADFGEDSASPIVLETTSVNVLGRLWLHAYRVDDLDTTESMTSLRSARRFCDALARFPSIQRVDFDYCSSRPSVYGLSLEAMAPNVDDVLSRSLDRPASNVLACFIDERWQQRVAEASRRYWVSMALPERPGAAMSRLGDVTRSELYGLLGTHTLDTACELWVRLQLGGLYSPDVRCDSNGNFAVRASSTLIDIDVVETMVRNLSEGSAQLLEQVIWDSAYSVYNAGGMRSV